LWTEVITVLLVAAVVAVMEGVTHAVLRDAVAAGEGCESCLAHEFTCRTRVSAPGLIASIGAIVIVVASVTRVDAVAAGVLVEALDALKVVAAVAQTFV
jgi:hypothetical protein